MRNKRPWYHEVVKIKSEKIKFCSYEMLHITSKGSRLYEIVQVTSENLRQWNHEFVQITSAGDRLWNYNVVQSYIVIGI